MSWYQSPFYDRRLAESQKQTRLLERAVEDAAAERRETTRLREAAEEAARTPEQRASDGDFKMGLFAAFVGLVCATMLMQLAGEVFPSLMRGTGVLDYTPAGKRAALVVFPVCLYCSVRWRQAIALAAAVLFGGAILWSLGGRALESFFGWLNT